MNYVRPLHGLYLVLMLAGLVLAGRAGAGSIVRLGPCVNPHCNVPPPNSGFVGVATGNYHSMGLRSDGSVAAWGMCDVEQCNVPSPNAGFTAISAGHSHSLALRQDGSIAAWGSNENGELYVPAPNTGFVAVAAGDGFSLGLKSDGSLVAWGQLDQDGVPPPNRGYLAVTANRGLGDALKSDASDPIFSEAPPISTSGGQTITAVATDIDGDGDQDIVSAEYGVNVVAWYQNNGASPPVWTKRLVDSFAFGPQTVAVADGDGDLDIFVWYENNGATPPAWTKRLISGFEGPWGVHAADVDGDGDVDGIGGMRLDGPDHHGVDWYENNGGSPPSFTIRTVSSGFVDAASVFAVDDDGDEPMIDSAEPAGGTNACGAGSYGASSLSAERVSTACP